MYRIIGADRKEYGPVSAEDLRKWIAEGRVNAQTLAWTSGMNTWQPLRAFAEFAGRLSAPAQVPLAPYAPRPRSNGIAIAGLIFGLLSIPCCWTFFFPLLGLIFSIIGLVQTNRESEKSGRSAAIIGLVISALMLLAAIAFWIIAAIGAANDGNAQQYQL